MHFLGNPVNVERRWPPLFASVFFALDSETSKRVAAVNKKRWQAQIRYGGKKHHLGSFAPRRGQHSPTTGQQQGDVVGAGGGLIFNRAPALPRHSACVFRVPRPKPRLPEEVGTPVGAGAG
jgi:hypothetical protein